MLFPKGQVLDAIWAERGSGKRWTSFLFLICNNLGDAEWVLDNQDLKTLITIIKNFGLLLGFI